MSQTFACPNCTANLAHDGGNHLTVRCPYCNSTVVVPESLRPQVHRQEFAPLLAQQAKLQEIIRLINMDDIEQAVHHFMNTFGVDANTAADAVERLAAGLSLAHQHTFTRQSQQTHSSGAGCLLKGFVALIVLVVIGSVVLPLLGGTAVLWSLLSGDGEPGAALNIPEFSAISGTPSADNQAQIVLTTVAQELGGLESLQQTDESSAATPLFLIGERGINPGQFNDARALAIGNDGTIYVADRDSGRLQLFSADGTYQTTWPWDKEKYTGDLEIGGDGTLYAEQSGRIYRYDLSGTPLSEVVYTEDIAVSFSQLALTVNGDLLAINQVRNNIIRFDSNGAVQQTITMDSAPSALSFDNLAVDGLGNIYVIGAAEDVLGDRQNVVFKFTPEGQFASQFGSDGHEPGLFLGIVSAIAVDGQGRIYVADFQGIQIFDNNGRFLDLIKLDGVARDLAFNNQGDLVAVTSQHKLYKFAVNELGE